MPAPASYRIVPRLLGQTRRALSLLEEVAESALGETASNPTFVHGTGNVTRNEAVISTGAFHNATAAPAIDSVAASWADLALVAHRHVVKLHRGAVSGLPDRLLPPGTYATTAHSTTYLEYVPNQAVEEMRRLVRPTLLAAGEVAASSQDDVAVTAPVAYLAEREVATRLDEVLAVLAVTCSQALHVTGRRPSPRLAELVGFVRSFVPQVESRRELGAECGRLAEAFSAAIEGGAGGAAAGPLSRA
jgi:histidine ammonia-lyase